MGFDLSGFVWLLLFNIAKASLPFVALAAIAALLVTMALRAAARNWRRRASFRRTPGRRL